MPAYRPGQGLNGEALDRLRSRMTAGDAALAMPSQDESQQWERLLGEGAKKKTRCGICTKPLDDALRSLGHGIPLCGACASAGSGEAPAAAAATEGSLSTADTARWLEGRHSLQPKIEPPPGFCSTPSTEVTSEFEALLDTAHEALAGDWEDDRGYVYSVRCIDETQWTCTERDSRGGRTCTLTYDSHRQRVWAWWGEDYFANMCDFSQDTDKIVWHKAGPHWRWMPAFTWSRHQTNNTESWHRETHGAEYEWHKEAAIHAIEEQLESSGRAGFIWIADWSTTYYPVLGCLRHFIESCPEKFQIVPVDGKKFSVARVVAEPKWRPVVRDASARDAAEAKWKPVAEAKFKAAEGWSRPPADEWRPAEERKWKPVEASSRSRAACEPTREPQGLADEAIFEIERQLGAKGNRGFVWLSDWKDKYLRSLGALRDFLESRPDKFTIVPGRGRAYRVALAVED